MAAPVRVKICGLTTAETLDAATGAGAAYVGFVFFPPSPRCLAPTAARDLALRVPPGTAKVALTVDADNDTLDHLTATVPLDILQLQGAEPPERVAEVRARTGLPIMKAVGIREAGDLAALDTYAAVADQLLVDAKPPKDAILPGGNGTAFDWRLLEGRRWPVPWLLAGGLTADTVATAIAATGARQVDVSSGVERAKGVKDPDLIRGFLSAAHGLATRRSA